MSVTFEACWRMVLGHAPLAGASLAREWTQWAYDEFVAARRSWSHLRVQSGLSIAASRSGTCGVVQNSAAVSSGTLAFVAGEDRKSTRLNSSHTVISYAVFCLKKNSFCHLPVSASRLKMNLDGKSWQYKAWRS